MEVAVIGGGVAGLSSAAALCKHAHVRVQVIEREAHLFAHSSGHSAAIYRPLETEPSVCGLARRSAALLDRYMQGRDRWLKTCGLWLVAAESEALAPLVSVAQNEGLNHKTVTRDELARRVPILADGEARRGLEVPSGGVLDPHAICMALRRVIRSAGGTIMLGAEVERLLVAKRRVRGIKLCDGAELRADVVVLAAGAWANDLGAAVGAPLPLTPYRRHLTLLAPPDPQAGQAALFAAKGPVIWDVQSEIYFRPESGQVLASPGDEDGWIPERPPVAPSAVELLASKLRRLAPPLWQSGVRRSWACLRTFMPDRAPVIGADLRVAGLYWLAGLGGHGMTIGAAAGELVADAVLERNTPHDAFAPGRLGHAEERC